ncbi:hypothetical protein EDC96DRAFT_499026 [Choanephora cucurbitarum]|nr:hypothetical protein EDC96DRAFT_499026 [Choanephora cucurbitarum]
MINNNGEGGRECAALATVFGVPEYIDSKIFWERQQYQQEGLLSRKPVNPLLWSGAPTDNKYGYVSVNHISVVKNPISSSMSPQEESDLLQQHDIQSEFVISSYVDSVLDHVGSNDLLHHPFLGATSTSTPTPTPSKSFSLPSIPSVSKFNDILIEGEDGFDIMLPANPSSVLIHSSTPIIRSGSNSSVHSTYTLPSQQKDEPAILVSEKQEELIDEARVIIGPPEIFTLIISDEDERFIVWGPDPIAVSSSMATTTTLERPSSYASLYNSQYERPELKGFSSNTTANLTVSKSVNQSLNKERKHSFASMRLSAQILSENLKLGRYAKHTENNAQNPTYRSRHSSLLLKKAFGIGKKNTMNKNSLMKPTEKTQPQYADDVPKVIEAATIHKLVEKLTNTLDYTFMTDFFLTYRDFLSSGDLCELLISRFYWALQNDEEERRIVRIRTFVVLRHWLNNYFVHDFIGNRPLRMILTDFLNRLPRHPIVKKSPRDQRIVKMLKRVVRCLKKLYYNQSSGASRVKVIPPPPPTAEQEQMGEIVRAKLAQNPIRRKVTLKVDMSGHHNGNMAIQDARYARVVVVGSLNMKNSFAEPSNDSTNSQSRPSSTLQDSSASVTNNIISQPDDGKMVQSPRNSQYERNNYEPQLAEIPQEEDDEAEEEDQGQEKVDEIADDRSVASDNSLESELSAGETIINEFYDSEESDDDDNDGGSQAESNLEHDEHDRHWLQEQQETLEYFKKASSSEEPAKSQQQPHSDIVDLDSSTGITSKVSQQAKSPLESDLISESSMPTTPTSTSNLPKSTIHRVPSEKWCKAEDEHNSTKPKLPFETPENILPVELLRELGTEELNGIIPEGLARTLSRKSIEKRKSEKNLRAASGKSSAVSSANTSPYLTGTRPDSKDVPEVPELPPLIDAVVKKAQNDISRKKSKSSPTKKKHSNVHQDNAEPSSIDAFVSIPYESTAVVGAESLRLAKETDASKLKLSKVISKVLRANNEQENSKRPLDDNLSSQSGFEMSNSGINGTDKIQIDSEPEPEPVQTSQLVSLIAQRLRNASIDEASLMEEGKCQCYRCSGNSNGSPVCRRLSIMLIADEERRRSIELRKKRGASVDMEKIIVHSRPEGTTVQSSKQPKQAKNGPVYLGHLQARSKINTNFFDDSPTSAHATPESSDDEDDDHTSYVHSERSIQTEAQASSSRARISMISDAPTEQPKSKMIEIEIPPLSSSKEIRHARKSSEIANRNAHMSIPQPLSPRIPTAANHSGRCFIMMYKTSFLAEQLCFAERDVLVKVGWEELIHCKWTKMDASGNITTNPFASGLNSMNSMNNDEHISYTRQTEQRRTQEQGIEQVIQRFNTVCQWVASEIVRTKSINERVKLIEKFIRLAAKCKAYSNYATLLQILLGLQSPAVARLEKTWSKVNTKCQKQLSKLTEFTSPMKNWKHVRDSMTEVAEEYGHSPEDVQVELPGTTSNKQKFKRARIKIPFGGCIPFLGIYLSDLVFNSEKPRYLKPNLESQKIYSANNTRRLPDCLNQPLVNFRKYRVVATVIKRVLTFQRLAIRYSFDEDGYLLEKCKNLEVLDAATIRELSMALE